MWALLASYAFYGTGHHATLGHVRWAPAFHAGDPNYLDIGPPITASLVSLELFGKLVYTSVFLITETDLLMCYPKQG